MQRDQVNSGTAVLQPAECHGIAVAGEHGEIGRELFPGRLLGFEG